MKNQLWLPTIPMTLIDKINRKAAAEGSVYLAMKSANADYNGHYVTVGFNEYRKYWVAEYHWGERVVLARGTAKDCIREAHAEYARGSKGCTVVLSGDRLTFEERTYAASLGFVPYDVDADRNAPPADERFNMINEAFMYEKQLGIPAIGLLANSATVAEYKAKLETEFKSRWRA